MLQLNHRRKSTTTCEYISKPDFLDFRPCKSVWGKKTFLVARVRIIWEVPTPAKHAAGSKATAFLVLLCTQVDIIRACANSLLKLWAGLAVLAKPIPTWNIWNIYIGHQNGWVTMLNHLFRSVLVCLVLIRACPNLNPMGTIQVKIMNLPAYKPPFFVLRHFVSSNMTLQPLGTNNSHRPSFSSQFSKLSAMNSTDGTKVLKTVEWPSGCRDHIYIYISSCIYIYILIYMYIYIYIHILINISHDSWWLHLSPCFSWMWT